MQTMFRRATILCAIVHFASAALAQAPFAELAAKVPSSANAISMISVEKILASKIAVKEDWASRYDKAFAAGMVSISPNSRRVLLATQLDFKTKQSAWDIALVDLIREVSMASVARQTKGLPDTIGRFPAVVLREDAYIIDLGKNQVAAMSPANRQAVLRWIRQTQKRTDPAISPYLQRAIALADKIDIVQALDMEGVVPESVVREKLKSSSALAGKKVDVEELTTLLTSIQGVTFEVVFKEARHARFLIDFGQDAKPLASVGKPLLLEILAGAGARIEDFDTWKSKVDGKQFILTGTLSATGMRKVFSLIDAPVATFSQADKALTAKTATAAQNSQAAYASQSYFKSIDSVLRDVRNDSRTADSFGQNALWLAGWARQIDRIPMVGVDPDLLDYGGFVAEHLRGASAALQGVGIAGSQRAAQVYNNGYEWNPVASERRAVRADERAKGVTSARDILRQIENATSDIRRSMAKKYNVNF